MAFGCVRLVDFGGISIRYDAFRGRLIIHPSYISILETMKSVVSIIIFYFLLLLASAALAEERQIQQDREKFQPVALR
jgi:hypothetical protein